MPANCATPGAACFGSSSQLTCAACDAGFTLDAAANTCTAANPCTAANTCAPQPQTPGVARFCGNFVSGCAPGSAIEAAWAAFRASLNGTYDTFTVASSLGGSVTVTDATKVQLLADGLRTATATQVNINGVDWFVGLGCGPPSAVEFFGKVATPCNCIVSVSLRPDIGNANWGAVDANTCNAPSQTRCRGTADCK